MKEILGHCGPVGREGDLYSKIIKSKVVQEERLGKVLRSPQPSPTFFWIQFTYEACIWDLSHAASVLY